jgi:hypothetical protein
MVLTVYTTVVCIADCCCGTLHKQVSGLSMSLLGCFAVFCACVGPLMQLYCTSGLVMANCLGTLASFVYNLPTLTCYANAQRSVKHPKSTLSFGLYATAYTTPCSGSA